MDPSMKDSSTNQWMTVCSKFLQLFLLFLVGSWPSKVRLSTIADSAIVEQLLSSSTFTKGRSSLADLGMMEKLATIGPSLHQFITQQHSPLNITASTSHNSGGGVVSMGNNSGSAMDSFDTSGGSLSALMTATAADDEEMTQGSDCGADVEINSSTSDMSGKEKDLDMELSETMPEGEMADVEDDDDELESMDISSEETMAKLRCASMLY